MRRIALIGIAIPVGLATGLAAWVLADGLTARAGALETTHARLVGMRPPAAAAHAASYDGAATLLGTPLFALTTGPGAVREPSIRVDGISMSRRRMAALVSIDAKPAEWLNVGETRDGVSLQAIAASSATFETALGTKTLNLGDQSAASAPAAGASTAQAAVTPVVQDQVPQGFRSPPEPASAPQPR